MSVTAVRHCVSCGQPMHCRCHAQQGRRRAGARGLCMTCYLVAWRNGTLDDYERVYRPAEELLDEWVRLRADGYGYRDAAARLGVTPEALDQALSRAKRRGDDRGCRSVADLAHWRRATVTDRRKDPAMNGDVPDRLFDVAQNRFGVRNQIRAVLAAATADDLEALAPAAIAEVRARALREVDDDPYHVIDLREDGWTLKHPLACRPRLYDCPVNIACEWHLTRPPAAPGRYRLDIADGRPVLGPAVCGDAPKGGDR